MEIRENVELAPLTYYKIGGPARYFAQPESIEDLAAISEFLRKNDISYFILGAGSNILVNDAGFDGLVIHTARLNRTIAQNADLLEVGSSAMVIQVLRHCMANGFGGLDFLVGIPGNMGGVLCMNAGTKTGDVNGAVVEVTAYDLESNAQRVIKKADLKYSYRAQHFLKPHEVILGGKLKGYLSEPKTIQDQVTNLLNARKRSQPIDKPSCGSVFKNPTPDLHAWKVVTDAGLRGYRIGNAQISEMHTNFIVNLGKAKAADVVALIEEAKKRAKDQSGVVLEEEVKVIPPTLPQNKLYR